MAHRPTPTTAADLALPAALHMGPVTLGVADLGRATDFYTRVLGMQVLKPNDKSGSNDTATVGAGITPLLNLHAIPGAVRQPPYSTSLYHVAILMPTREDLGHLLLNLTRTRYPLGGASDHLVSEALYLSDPDGNGLEIYRDRPRQDWRWQGTSVVMATQST